MVVSGTTKRRKTRQDSQISKQKPHAMRISYSYFLYQKQNSILILSTAKVDYCSRTCTEETR